LLVEQFHAVADEELTTLHKYHGLLEVHARQEIVDESPSLGVYKEIHKVLGFVLSLLL
jgi:hypothetical protein